MECQICVHQTQFRYSQQKQKQRKRNTITKEKRETIKQSSSQTIKHNPFPKTLLLQQLNTTTEEKQRNQQTQDPPGVLLGSDRTGFAGVAGIGSYRIRVLELIGSDQWFSLTLSCSISLIPHRSSPGFCSGRIGPGFYWSWVLLEQKNRVQ